MRAVIILTLVLLATLNHTPFFVPSQKIVDKFPLAKPNLWFYYSQNKSSSMLKGFVVLEFNYTIVNVTDTSMNVLVNADFGSSNATYLTTWTVEDNFTDIFVSTLDYNKSLYEMLNRQYGLLLNYTDWLAVYERFNVTKSFEKIGNENTTVLWVVGNISYIYFRIGIAEKYGLLIERTLIVPETTPINPNATTKSIQYSTESFKLVGTNAFATGNGDNESNDNIGNTNNDTDTNENTTYQNDFSSNETAIGSSSVGSSKGMEFSYIALVIVAVVAFLLVIGPIVRKIRG